MRNSYETTPEETANFTRRQVATAIRSKKPKQVMMLAGGYNIMSEKPVLHYMGVYGACVSVPFCAHGYGAMFTLSLLDRWYHPNMEFDEALELFKKVCEELKRRFICNLPNFKIKKIDKDGVTDCGWLEFSKDIHFRPQAKSSVVSMS